MNCQDMKTLAVAYLDDEVTSSERSLILAHLAECEACRSELGELQALQGRLQRSLKASAASASPPAQAWEQLRQGLAHSPNPQTRPRPARPGIFPYPMFTFQGENPMRKFVFATLLIIVCAFSITAFVPAARAQAIDVIKRFILGEYATAVQVPPQAESQPESISDDMWIIRTETGNFGGNAPPGVAPVVHYFTNIEAAQPLVTFPIQRPAQLPEGYALREVKVAPIGASGWVFLFYGGPGHDILIVQMPTSQQPSEEPNTVNAVALGVMTDGELEEVDFNGHPALWVDGHSLMWQVDGINYSIGGLDLSLEQAIQIGLSLQ